MRDWLLHDLRLESDLLGNLSLDELRQYLSVGFKQHKLRILLQLFEAMQQELS